MNCSMPGFPVLYYFLEYARIHVHWVSDAVQPSHPLLPPSPPVLNLSQHQSLFQWIGSLNQVAKVLELSALASVLPVNMQGWFPLGLTDLISLLSRGLSKSLLQHHSLKVSILRRSALFTVQTHLVGVFKTSVFLAWFVEFDDNISCYVSQQLFTSVVHKW